MKTRPTHTLFSIGAALVVFSACAADTSNTGDESQSPADGLDEQANIIFSECTPNPCTNGGTCTDTLIGFQCSCIGGFTGTLCDVAPTGQPPAQPPVLPPLFPSDHKLSFNVQQTFEGIVNSPADITGVTVTVNGQVCAPGACTTTVAAGASATVQVRLAVRSGAPKPLPMLRSWGDCIASTTSFEHIVNADQTSSISWTSTLGNLDADKTCTASFAQAATFWFHLPALGPSVAKAEPAEFCDFVVNPIYIPQIPEGAESWSTSCMFPPGTTVTLTPFYQGRQLSEMVCATRESPDAEFTKLRFTSTPAVIPTVRAGQNYECALEKLPE
jgi:hypothetical protein